MELGNTCMMTSNIQFNVWSANEVKASMTYGYIHTYKWHSRCHLGLTAGVVSSHKGRLVGSEWTPLSKTNSLELPGTASFIGPMDKSCILYILYLGNLYFLYYFSWEFLVYSMEYGHAVLHSTHNKLNCIVYVSSLKLWQPIVMWKYKIFEHAVINNVHDVCMN